MTKKPGIGILTVGVLLPIIYFILILSIILKSPDIYSTGSADEISSTLYSIVTVALSYLVLLMPSSYENVPLLIFGSFIGLIGFSNLILWIILRTNNSSAIVNAYWVPLRFLCGLSIGLSIMCALLQLPGIPMLAFGIFFATIMSTDSGIHGIYSALVLLLIPVSIIILLLPFLVGIASIMLSTRLKLTLSETLRKETSFWIGILGPLIFLISVFIAIISLGAPQIFHWFQSGGKSSDARAPSQLPS